MKKLFYLAVCLLSVNTVFAQLQSPENFLGYEIGSRFTPHHLLTAYFQHVAKEAPGEVQLLKYGETNEGRPLYLAFVSTAQNIRKLERIRENNIDLTKNGSAQDDQPLIIWFSYNVHGNEASSSEAAMLTLYTLASQQEHDTKEWLQNAVVIIDPCLNPDGRERYVNWYTSVVGNHFNPNPQSREHSEPWPGGRSNHYYYDLNRDWAWQTQVESRARMKQYNRWMPQIHVDFHEQGYNSPYYFAPAAKPYHEALTPWQREFQVTIGRNNAKYFDKNNWLYFTKEIFDLFYPSYGDTYPLYNGAIGMTYEQAGSGAAGLGIRTAEGDTLTLATRALHHYTSGFSTLEVSSQNRQRLLEEYQTFFRKAQAGDAGKFKTYIIKYRQEDEQRLQALKNLLDKNQIEYGTASGKTIGFNYDTGKDEDITISDKDLVISTSQTRGTLANILFEPRTRLEDSVTYDITAWALPYAYGLQAYASIQKMNINPVKQEHFVKNPSTDSYAYAFDWQGIASAKITAALLKKGIRLRYSLSPFKIGRDDFDRGAVIITQKGNEKFGDSLWTTIATECDKNQVRIKALSTGYADEGFDFGSPSVKYMPPVKAAVFTGPDISSIGTGEIWDFFDNTLDYPLTLVNLDYINRISWDDINVLILPDGNYDFLSDEQSAEPLLSWIRKGGKLIALEGAVKAIAEQKWSSLKMKQDTIKENDDEYLRLKRYENREQEYVTSNIPGAIFKVDVDNSHPLMFGYPNSYYTLKLDDHVYDFMENGWNVAVLKKEKAVSGFVGHGLQPKLKDAVIFGVQEMGAGSIIYLTDNVLFRNFWENGKLIFCNAVFH